MELEGLESILSGEPEAPIVEPKSDLHETSPIVDRARDDHGRFASKEKGELPSGEEPPVVVPPTTTQESDHVPRTALLDERRKRQELEQRIQQMEQQYQNRPAEPEQPSDFWEDPNTFLESRFNQFGQTLLQQWEPQRAFAPSNGTTSSSSSTSRRVPFREMYGTDEPPSSSSRKTSARERVTPFPLPWSTG
jgi:hypothetical protein